MTGLIHTITAAVSGRKGMQEAVCILLLAVLGFCVYSNSFNGEFVFDDVTFYKSPAVQLETLSWQDIVTVAREMVPGTRPVANVSFALNYYFHGFEVRGYHIVNLIIHILTGIALYLFFKTTLNLVVVKREFNAGRWIPCVAAAIWLVHPIQTQAVSYIVQRMTSLSALFYILSLLLYAWARLSEKPYRKLFLFVGCVAAGLLSMASKEIGATLPFFILLYEWFFFQNLDWQWVSRNKKYWIGLFVFLVVIIVVFLGSNPMQRIEESYRLVHELDFRDFTLQERVLTEFRVLFFYLSLLVFPSPSRLSLEHDFLLSTSLLQPLTTVPAIIGVLGLVMVAMFAAPRFRLASFGVLWFFGNHVIEGSVLPLEIIFEHRNYLPSTMLILAGVVTMSRLLPGKSLQITVCCLIIALFSYWTYQRNFVWQSRIALWQDCVEKVPTKPRPHNNLGVALKAAGRIDEAIFHYREAVRHDPGYIEAYVNLGNVMMQAGRYDEAARYYRKGITVFPNHIVLNLQFAHALFDSGRFNRARQAYMRVLSLDPGNRDARVNLSRLNKALDTGSDSSR